MMIRFNNVSKSFILPNGGVKVILDEINVSFPAGRSVGLLGRNGAGKSTLLEMIGGRLRPDDGSIEKAGTVSWPVGFAGSFKGDMTGAQNTRFVARVYGIDSDDLAAFVEDFAELGAHFHAPVRSYSSGMKSRLAFGISIGIPFDTYLVDEVTAVGDAAFKQKSRLFFKDRMRNAGAVVVTHSMPQLRKLCDAGAVLENGKLTYFEDVDEAIEKHHANMGSEDDD